MERIYPLQEDVISRCRGMLVCVIFKNGARHIGVLESCHNGIIELGESPFGRSAGYMAEQLEPQSGPATAVTPNKSSPSRKNKKAKAAGASKANQSPTNYAPQSDYPASAGPHNKAAVTAKIPLNDIALLFLLI